MSNYFNMLVRARGILSGQKSEQFMRHRNGASSVLKRE